MGPPGLHETKEWGRDRLGITHSRSAGLLPLYLLGIVLYNIISRYHLQDEVNNHRRLSLHLSIGEYAVLPLSS